MVGPRPQRWLRCRARREDLDRKGVYELMWICGHHFIVSEYLERASWEPGGCSWEHNGQKERPSQLRGTDCERQGHCAVLELAEQSWDRHGEGTGRGRAQFKEEARGQHLSKGLRRWERLAGRGTSMPPRVRAAWVRSRNCRGRVWGSREAMRP